MELNAEQIVIEIQGLIKALKANNGWWENRGRGGWFNHDILEDALDLITSQEQDKQKLGLLIDELEKEKRELFEENKRLTEESKKWEQAYDCMHSACLELSDKCDRLTEENERLIEKADRAYANLKAVLEERKGDRELRLNATKPTASS